MTYLYRLAKRIACLRRVVPVALMAGVACSKGDKVGYLSSPDPNPTQPAAFSLRVEPLIASVRSGHEVQFTATAYSVTGTVVPVSVDWTAAGGNISPDGRFIGGPAGQYSVVARIRNQAAITDSARVSVWETDNELVELIVFPDSAVVDEGDSLQAMAALRLSNGDLTQEAQVTWSATGGSIDENGMFTAPVTGAYVVTAQSPVGLLGRATVLVQRKARQLGRISVDPPAATILRGQSATFTATGYYSDGSSGSLNAAWSATGGSISSSGNYVAGGVSGNYEVVARDRNSGFADTAVVAVMTPNVVRLAISPKTLAIDPEATRQFSALAQLSDGTWQSVPLSWSASAGSISNSGVFTAPSQPGSYSVVVTSPGLPMADTATVVVATPVATLTALHINPSSVSLGAGELRQFSATADWSDGSTTTPAVTWSAGGGTISSSGLFTAGASPGTFQVIGRTAGGQADTSTVVVTTPVLTSLSLSPGTAGIVAGGTVQFVVAGTWSDGGNGSPVVVWNVAGGNMTGSGLFNAGSEAGTFAIIATQQGGTLADTSFVTVRTPDPTLSGLLLSPGSGVVAPGGHIDFTVLGTWSDGSTGVPPVTYTATGGTMSGNRYTAGSTAGTYRVIAKHSYSIRADTSSVTITVPVTLSSLSVSPDAPSVAPGASQQFSISATWSNGSTALPLVNWTATGGTITTGGLYTAGSVPGAFRVIVAHQGGTKRDTANVTILGTPPAPSLTSLTVAPDPVSLDVNTTRLFTLSANWSDGSNAVPAVTWTATGGTVSTAGAYTAGAVAGTYRVIATQQGGGKADTAAVTVTSGATPVVTSLVINPGSVSLPAGTSQAFSATGNFSNGTTGPVSVTWSATGGTMSSNGIFTAGGTAGSYQARATLVGGVLTSTSSVTVSVPSTSGCVGGAHQPTGFFAIVGRHFNSLATTNPSTGYGNGRGTGPLPCMVGQSEGWDDVERVYNKITLASDATAPSPNGIMRMLYPAQTVATGSTYSPGVSQTMSFTGATYGVRNYRKLYLRFAVKVSANFQGHSTSTNKLFFIRSEDESDGNRAEPIIRLRGVGTGPLVLSVDPQGMLRDKRQQPGIPASAQSFSPNQGASGEVTRGVWHVVEAVLEMGINGAENGRLRLWLDGVLTHDYNDLEYDRTTTPRYWNTVVIAPTWGGVGGTINQLMWLDFDEVFVSGAP